MGAVEEGGTVPAPPTDLVMPFPGYLTANAAADFLGDGSTVVVFSGPIWPPEPTLVPFKAVRVDQNCSLSDVSAELLPEGTAAVLARAALAVDFNGDRYPDLYGANTGVDVSPWPGEKQVLLMNNGLGKLTNASAELPDLISYVHSAAAGDVRGNGQLDLLVGVLGMQQNQGLADQYRGPNTRGDWLGPYLLRNDGVGNFTYDNQALAPEVAASDGAPHAAPGRFVSSLFAELDGDAFPDLVLGSDQNSAAAGVVYLNDGSGNFTTTAHPLPPGRFGEYASIDVHVAALDLNQDERLDLLLSETPNDPYYEGRAIQVLLNQGDGTFVDETEARIPGQTGQGRWIVFFQLVDFDRDGAMDVVLQSDDPAAEGGAILINDGTGHFAPLPRAELPAMALSWLVAADFNHDGRVDLVSFACNGTSVTVAARCR
jgi:hypothetical protein